MAAPETTTAAAPTDPGLASASPGEAPTVAKKAKLGFGGWLALAWMAAIVIMALLAPFLPLAAPAPPAFRPMPGMFSADDIFGTEHNGRAALARGVDAKNVVEGTSF